MMINLIISHIAELLLTRTTYMILFFILFSYEELKDRVSTGDGQYKLVYAISGEIPGPNIVVFKDQIVS